MIAWRTLSLVTDAALTGRQWYMLMIHLHRAHLPITCGMTGITFVGSRDVVRRLSRRAIVVVTTHAASQYLIMIHTYHRYPGKCPVAGFTTVGGRNMGCRLASGQCAIVAGDTTIDYGAMIKYGRHPGRCAMAIIAFVASG